eukprot:TRINITY_DN62978_c0_g1_i1.p1 TRINITY_DN62978_c0_g1~~TRINITY_DN62978_c0_g1_i1.p1  ORF type:complete len:252 (-),score=0.24 TRINITY_DN62978_c0_g1_i1:117-872(-)
MCTWTILFFCPEKAGQFRWHMVPLLTFIALLLPLSQLVELSVCLVQHGTNGPYNGDCFLSTAEVSVSIISGTLVLVYCFAAATLLNNSTAGPRPLWQKICYPFQLTEVIMVVVGTFIGFPIGAAASNQDTTPWEKAGVPVILMVVGGGLFMLALMSFCSVWWTRMLYPEANGYFNVTVAVLLVVFTVVTCRHAEDLPAHTKSILIELACILVFALLLHTCFLAWIIKQNSSRDPARDPLLGAADRSPVNSV